MYRRVKLIRTKSRPGEGVMGIARQLLILECVDLSKELGSFSGRVRMWLFGGTPSNALFLVFVESFEGWMLEGTSREWLEMNGWRS